MFHAVPELPDVIWEYQFRQREHELELRVVPREAYRDEHGRRLVAALDKLLHAEIPVRVACVGALEPGAGEKARMLVDETVLPRDGAREDRPLDPQAPPAVSADAAPSAR
jgi:hypothetical protein